MKRVLGRGPAGRVVTGALWAAAGSFAVAAGARLGGFGRRYPVAPALAFTPYAAAGALATAATALVARRRGPALLAAAAGAALSAVVLPRVVPSGPPPAGARRLRLLTGNVLYGAASPAELRELVRRLRVEVCCLQEITKEYADALALDFPYEAIECPPDVDGAAIFSRYPLREVAFTVNPGALGQLTALVDVPGGRPVEVTCAHPAPPDRANVAYWLAGLAALPSAGVPPRGVSSAGVSSGYGLSSGGASSGGLASGGLPSTGSDVLRVLAGDFNATLDHVPLRGVLARGYRDAAATVGAGLQATWPYAGRRLPPVTIDHILVDRRIGVVTASTHPMPGSDHRALFATLVLPH